MPSQAIQTMGVVGAGQMGAGIAFVSALAGCEVLLYDIHTGSLEAALERIHKGFDKQIQDGIIPASEGEAALKRIRTTQSLGDMTDRHLILEAAPENSEMKCELFRQLGAICKPDVILASNTSSISITKLGAMSGRDAQVAGMHFMNPVPVMKLVELVRGLRTSDETISLLAGFADRMGKVVVESKDSPGFIVNRLLMPMVNEAIFAFAEGIATADMIDKAMTHGTNHPVGPLALADRIGLDTVLNICEILYQEFGDQKFRPCPLLRKYVEAGWLGRKSGKGFYSYHP
ncbi:3-hydroxyacyl-CoA dehydrogenase family protein [Candidatus Nitrospira allomarina]|uniref:3-hydroxybutyryl-CoA dehydrogenase n=1 Tax=Candidatus Nitrospira allomarina TaxID=3020900 RepID=A0AA96JVL3_9BACT|nr:3-hydroxybutyryl-CoA dehydrogenase [Candidatus Nitrospira allomarina]WNM57046.1 3-hydroxybutyryl-CoA dehydrogenase [Candidatus Nitrospira allomarina]